MEMTHQISIGFDKPVAERLDSKRDFLSDTSTVAEAMPLTGLSPEAAPSQGRHSFSESSIRDHVPDAGLMDNIEGAELKAQAPRNLEDIGNLKDGSVSHNWWTKLMVMIGGGDSTRGERRAAAMSRLVVSGAVLAVGVAFAVKYYKDNKQDYSSLSRAIDSLRKGENIIAMAQGIPYNQRQKMLYCFRVAIDRSIEARDKIDRKMLGFFSRKLG